jgi:hypothetical protein
MSVWRRYQVPMAALIAVTALASASVPFLRDWQHRLRAARASLVQQLPVISVQQDSVARIRDSVQARLQLERTRAASRADSALHLVIAVDSGTMALVRDGVALRTMPAQFAGAAPARGVRTITRMVARVAAPAGPLTDSLGNPITVRDTTQVTVERVSFDDGMELRGAAASDVVLARASGGARGVMVSRSDFDAIRPNLVKGMRAYIF